MSDHAQTHPETASHSSPLATSGSSGAASVSSKKHSASLAGDFDAQEQALSPVQRMGRGGHGPDVHAAAAHGISGSSGALPHGAAIQRAFGGYDISHVQAHTDAAAAMGSSAMGADAYATGDHVAFKGAPDLHTAAHEAAHVVQQQAGVQLSGGVGKVGDAYENHADRVADAVVAGQDASPILAEMAGNGGGGGAVQRSVVQRKEEDPPETTHDTENDGDRDEPPVEENFLTGPGPLKPLTPPVLETPVTPVTTPVVNPPPPETIVEGANDVSAPAITLDGDLGVALEAVALPEVSLPTVTPAALGRRTIEIGGALRIAGIHALGEVDKAAVEAESTIRTGVVTARSSVATALVQQTTAVQTAAIQKKSDAHLAIELKVMAVRDQLQSQKARLDALEQSLPQQINAAFDQLQADVTAAGLAAIAKAQSTGEGKQNALQVVPSTGSLSDYERRQNKARGDATSVVTDHVMESIAQAQTEALRLQGEKRQEMLSRAAEWLAEMKASVANALEGVVRSEADAKLAASRSVDEAAAELGLQLSTMKGNADAAITADALALVHALCDSASALKHGIAESVGSHAETVSAAISEASARLEAALAELDAHEGLEDGDKEAARAEAESAAVASVDEVLASAAGAIEEEAVGAVGTLREKGQAGSNALTQGAGVVAGTMAGIPGGFADVTAMVVTDAESAVAAAIQEGGATSNEVASRLAGFDSDAWLRQHTAAALTALTAEFDTANANLPALIDSHAETAANQVDKNARLKAWASVALSVVSVAATAFTIGVAVSFGSPLALALGVIGATGIALGKKAATDAIVKPATPGSVLKEAILGMLTGVAASAGALWLVKPAVAGATSLVELLPILVGIKAYLSTAAGFAAKVATRAVVGILPRKLDEAIALIRKKLSGAPTQLALPPADLESTVEANVAKDNADAKKVTSMGPLNTGLVGHTAKALIGG